MTKSWIPYENTALPRWHILSLYFSLCELQSAKHDAWDCSRPVSLWKPGSYHFSSDLIGRLAAPTYEFWQAAQLNVRDVDQKSDLSSIDEFRFNDYPSGVWCCCDNMYKRSQKYEFSRCYIYDNLFHFISHCSPSLLKLNGAQIPKTTVGDQMRWFGMTVGMFNGLSGIIIIEVYGRLFLFLHAAARSDRTKKSSPKKKRTVENSVQSHVR